MSRLAWEVSKARLSTASWKLLMPWLQSIKGYGYATAAARALAANAFESGQVSTVRAHTLPDGFASQRVLLKSGFSKVGEFVESDDGLVWRFELRRLSAGVAALSSN